jgi:hypothetical protein
MSFNERPRVLGLPWSSGAADNRDFSRLIAIAAAMASARGIPSPWRDHKKTLKIPHNFYNMLVMCAFSFCAIDPTTVCFFSN